MPGPTSTAGSNRIGFALVGSLFLLTSCWFFFKVGAVFGSSGWDYPQFYIAGHTGPRDLYSHEANLKIWKPELAGIGVRYIPPYVRPAAFALPLRAVMWLPYWTSFSVWVCLQAAFFWTTVVLLYSRLPLPPRLLPAFAFFIPATYGFVNGQDIATVGLLLCLGHRLLESGEPALPCDDGSQEGAPSGRDLWGPASREALAGFVLGLCVYKVNLILLIPAFLLLKRRFRALGAFTITALALAAVSCALAPAGRYLAQIHNIPKYTVFFSAGTMVGLRSLADHLGMPELYYPLAVLLAGATLWTIRRVPLGDGFGLALLGSLLCAYHVTWYDYTLLVIPIAFSLCSAARVARWLGVILLVYPLWFIQAVGWTPKVFHWVSLLTAGLLLGFWAGGALRGLRREAGARTEVSRVLSR